MLVKKLFISFGGFMITELTNQHSMLLNIYLNKLPMYSMYFTADIQKHRPTIYGCFDNEHLCCIFTKIINTLFIYSTKDEIPAKEILDYLNDHSIDFYILKAREIHSVQFEKYISFSTKHSALLCKLEKSNYNAVDCKDVNIVKATSANGDELMGFFNNVNEYKGLMNAELLNEGIGNGTYILYENTNVAGVAICNYYNRHISNISLLTTMPAYRGKGYGTKLLSYACNQLLSISESISICHEYNNANKIYKKLGFKEIGHINICIK